MGSLELLIHQYWLFAKVEKTEKFLFTGYISMKLELCKSQGTETADSAFPGIRKTRVELSRNQKFVHQGIFSLYVHYSLNHFCNTNFMRWSALKVDSVKFSKSSVSSYKDLYNFAWVYVACMCFGAGKVSVFLSASSSWSSLSLGLGTKLNQNLQLGRAEECHVMDLSQRELQCLPFLGLPNLTWVQEGGS